MLKLLLGLGGAMPLLMPPVMAQEVSVPSVTTASPGGYANPLKLDTDRYDREQRAKAKKRSRSRTGPPRNIAQACSAESVPAAEQQRIAEGYMRHAEDFGKESADIWVREEGVRYRMMLVRQGVCPPPTEQEMAALREWREQTRRDW